MMNNTQDEKAYKTVLLGESGIGESEENANSEIK